MTAAKPPRRKTTQKVDLHNVLKSQYRAALAMLRQAIEKCPPDLWTSRQQGNAFWHIAYHTLFFTHYYLQPRRRSFKKWDQHRKGCEHLSRTPSTAYTRAEILDYWDLCDAMVSPTVDKLDLHAASCDFPWYRMGKLEHQLVNIRHIQHHTAQLADRVRRATGEKFDWIGDKPRR